MHEGVGAVLLELAERDPPHLLEGQEMGLVVVGGRGRRVQLGQAGAHAVRREILDDSVVVVQPGVLAHDGNHQVAHGPETGLHQADTRTALS